MIPILHHPSAWSHKLVKCAIMLVILIQTLLYPIRFTHAQNMTFYHGHITSLSPDGNTMEILVKIENSQEKQIELPTFAEKSPNSIRYAIGDKLIIGRSLVQDTELYSVVDRDRTIPYGILIVLFLAFVVIIGRMQGIISVLAMALSFGLLTQFTIPQIVAGVDPVVVSLITGIVVVPLTFYLSHGFNHKTSLAVISTMIALILTGVLAVFFTRFVGLTGYASDEAAGLTFRFGDTLRLSDLLIAGMIISAMGVLDDVTISQIGFVQSLQRLKPDMKMSHLFTETMGLGRDHIASLVNTLILVYAGAALPLFLLVYQSQVPIWVVLQRESIAVEVTRTLVSSIGLIAAVPISTFIAVRWGRRKRGHLQKERLF